MNFCTLPLTIYQAKKIFPVSLCVEMSENCSVKDFHAFSGNKGPIFPLFFNASHVGHGMYHSSENDLYKSWYWQFSPLMHTLVPAELGFQHRLCHCWQLSFYFCLLVCRPKVGFLIDTSRSVSMDVLNNTVTPLVMEFMRQLGRLPHLDNVEANGQGPEVIFVLFNGKAEVVDLKTALKSPEQSSEHALQLLQSLKTGPGSCLSCAFDVGGQEIYLKGTKLTGSDYHPLLTSTVLPYNFYYQCIFTTLWSMGSHPDHLTTLIWISINLHAV